MILSVDDAISEFFSIYDQIEAEKELTIENVVKRFIRYYSDIRIKNADIENNGDMLLFQWGSYRILENINRVDLRKFPDNLVFSTEEYKILDFTRQVFAPEREDEEFDDIAIQMSIQLIYGLSTGDEPNSNIWIENLKEVNQKKISYFETQFVIERKLEKINKIIASVDNCG